MKLYKKDSKGKIRSLEIISEGNQLVQISGLLDGKKVEHRSNCTSKNVGRSNETTPEEQAISEAASKLTKKIDQGYFETIEEAQNEVVILPMLAKDYKKESHKIDWNSLVYAQPKLDGMRCLVIMKNDKITLMSRTGKEIITMDHIKEDLMQSYLEGMILDGELYAHGESFQENMKLIKKYRVGLSEAVSFHCYDVINLCEYEIRKSQLSGLFSNNEFKSVEPVTTILIASEAELKIIHAEFINDGYEGSIIRVGIGKYKINGRSSELLKYKDFIDEAYTIIDVVQSDKGLNQGNFLLTCAKGEFKCGMRFSHAEREEILLNKKDYIGKTAEIRFFEYSDDGIPRFPVCVGIRLDK